MLSPFHIFKVQSDGSLHWIEGAINVERAKARLNVLAACSCGEYVITDLTGKKISTKSLPKLAVFQIGYNEKELAARAELFRHCGHEVISAADNEAAKRVLASIQSVDVFVIGHMAPEQTRKEMVDWLKVNFSNVKIVALIPSASRKVPRADYNIILQDGDDWLSAFAAAGS